METIAVSLSITSERASFRTSLSRIIADDTVAAQNQAAYLLRNPR